MATRRRFLRVAGLGAAGLAGCTAPGSGGGGTPTPTIADVGTFSPPELSSPAFGDGDSIPAKYTCSGDDISPSLSVSNVADSVETLALVMDDPDAGETPYVHWLVWNVPASTTEWPAAVGRGETAEELDGAAQGTNSAGTVGYSGPCPPEGDGPHTYRFTVYGVASQLDVSPGADRGPLDDALRNETVSRSRFTGTYDR